MTGARRLSEELGWQGRRFEAIIANARDFIYTFDREARFTYVNQSLLDLWGKTLADVIGKDFHELDYPPELADRLRRQVGEVIETRRMVRDETPYTSASGTGYYEYIFVPLFAEDGAVVAVAGTTRDITERVATGEALRASEERYRLASEAVAGLLYDYDRRTGRVEYSPGLFDLLGYRPDAVPTASDWWPTRTHPDDRQRAAATFAAAMGDPAVPRYTIEYRLRHRDGREVWVWDRGFFVRDEAGVVVRAVGNIIDITARKAAEQALRVSEERYRSLVTAITPIVWTAAGSGAIVDTQSPLAGFTGMTFAEYGGYGWLAALHPDDRAETRATWLRALAEGTGVETEYRLRRHDGEYRMVAVRGVPIRDADGVTREWVGTLTDIHDRREAEARLRDTEAKLLALFQSDVIGIIWGEDERITEANDAFLGMVGRTRAELERGSLDWREMTPPEQRAESAARMRGSAATGRFAPFEKDFLRAGAGGDGGRVPAIIGGSALGADPFRFVAFALDITERKRAEAAVRRATAAEERLRDTFLSSISHDLRTPLTAMRAGLGMLEASAGDRLRADERSLLANARRNTDRLGRLVDDLVVFNHLSEDALLLDRAPVNLYTVATGAVASVGALFREAGQTLAVALASPLPVMGDRRRLEQVLVNLLDNAHRHTPPGTHIAVRGWHEGGFVRLTVGDTGPGIPRDALAHIFDRFYRRGDAGGSGLGLAIVRSITEMHGGTVAVTSEPGRGTIFALAFPATDGADGADGEDNGG